MKGVLENLIDLLQNMQKDREEEIEDIKKSIEVLEEKLVSLED